MTSETGLMYEINFTTLINVFLCTNICIYIFGEKTFTCTAWITLKAPRVEDTSPLLCSLHWLPIQKGIKHKVCSICYVTLTGTSPKYMSEFINVYIPSRSLHSSSDSHILKIPCVRTKTYGQHSFAYQGPANWNDLPLL